MDTLQYITHICAQTTSCEIEIETPTQISGCKYYSNMEIFKKIRCWCRAGRVNREYLSAAFCGGLAIRRWLVSVIEIWEAVWWYFTEFFGRDCITAPLPFDRNPFSILPGNAEECDISGCGQICKAFSSDSAHVKVELPNLTVTCPKLARAVWK